MDIVQLLQGALSPDPSIRQQSEALLNGFVNNQYGPFLLALCAEFAKESNPENSRQLFGIYLKNIITAIDEKILEEKVNRWLYCDVNIKAQIRVGFLQGLLSTVPIVRHTAAQIIAAFGAVDIPRGEWPDLIQQLLDNSTDPNTSSSVKISSLEALGYLCEDLEEASCLSPEVVNSILTVIMQGINETNENEIRLVSLKALLNSLFFAKKNFENEQESDFIVKGICEASQRSDAKERLVAYECIATIAEYFYEKLPRYMQTFAQLTLSTILTSNDETAIQALVFWQNITEAEIDAKEDLENRIQDTVMHNITSQCAQSLVPILLQSLTKQSEEDDVNYDDVNKLAGGVLSDVSDIIESSIIPLVIPFIHQNINNPDWHFKDAAITSFGLILGGPPENDIAPIVTQAIPFLVPCLRDQNPSIRDSTLWTFGRIFEYSMDSINPAILPEIMTIINALLSDSESHVIYQACLAIHSFASYFESNDETQETNPLSPYMATLIQSLMSVAYRYEDDIRNNTYEAINMLVRNSGNDMNDLVKHLLQDSSNRLELMITSGRQDFQGFLAVLIGVCVQKLGIENLASGGVAIVDTIIASFLRIVETKGSLAQEDTLMSLGNLIVTLEDGYQRYLDVTIPPILNNLRDLEQTSILIWSVGVVGDLCRSMNIKMTPYVNDIMTCMVQILESRVVDRQVKPPALSVFADISMAIGANIEPYLPHIMMYLEQAANVQPENEDDEEYINSVRSSICEAYTGLIQGLNGTDKISLLEPFIPQIRKFITILMQSDYNSDELLLKGSSLLGDIGQVYKLQMRQIFQEDHVLSLLQTTKESINDDDKTSIEQYDWAYSIVNGVLTGNISWE